MRLSHDVLQLSCTAMPINISYLDSILYDDGGDKSYDDDDDDNDDGDDETKVHITAAIADHSLIFYVIRNWLKISFKNVHNSVINVG